MESQATAHEIKANGKPASSSDPSRLQQHVFVVRHGDRADYESRNPKNTCARPFDPALTEGGLKRALKTGKHLAESKNVVIHKAYTSPFTRCVQTAAQTLEGLGDAFVGDGLYVDNGLCEVCQHGIIARAGTRSTNEVIFTLPELKNSYCPRLHADVPSPVPMPAWGESNGGGSTSWRRGTAAFTRLTDACLKLRDGEEVVGGPSSKIENILLVTHSGILTACIAAVGGRATWVTLVDYCGCAHFVREIGEDLKPGPWKFVNKPGDDGIHWEKRAH